MHKNTKEIRNYAYKNKIDLLFFIWYDFLWNLENVMNEIFRDALYSPL